MVLGSHQFSRHANQHTHGSRTHRLGRRHLACATAPLWHRPIYRQWGIPPRPETALASVAPVVFRASMPRVIYGGETLQKCGRDKLTRRPRSPFALKWCVFRAKRETATGTCIPNNHVLRPRRPQGRKRRESEDVPERSPRHAPGFPVGVLDLVGLSTYRRPADQR